MNSQVPLALELAIFSCASKSHHRNKHILYCVTHTKSTARSCAWDPTTYQSCIPRPWKRSITYASKHPFTTSISLCMTSDVGYGVWHSQKPDYAITSPGLKRFTNISWHALIRTRRATTVKVANRTCRLMHRVSSTTAISPLEEVIALTHSSASLIAASGVLPFCLRDFRSQ